MTVLLLLTAHAHHVTLHHTYMLVCDATILYSTGVGCEAVNLGTGVGYSVFDLVKCMEEASGKHIPYKVYISSTAYDSINDMYCC